MPAHPVGHGRGRVRFGGLSRQKDADEVAAAFVELPGQVHALGDELVGNIFLYDLSG